MTPLRLVAVLVCAVAPVRTFSPLSRHATAQSRPAGDGRGSVLGAVESSAATSGGDGAQLPGWMGGGKLSLPSFDGLDGLPGGQGPLGLTRKQMRLLREQRESAIEGELPLAEGQTAPITIDELEVLMRSDVEALETLVFSPQAWQLDRLLRDPVSKARIDLVAVEVANRLWDADRPASKAAADARAALAAKPAIGLEKLVLEAAAAHGTGISMVDGVKTYDVKLPQFADFEARVGFLEQTPMARGNPAKLATARAQYEGVYMYLVGRQKLMMERGEWYPEVERLRAMMSRANGGREAVALEDGEAFFYLWSLVQLGPQFVALDSGVDEAMIRDQRICGVTFLDVVTAGCNYVKQAKKSGELDAQLMRSGKPDKKQGWVSWLLGGTPEAEPPGVLETIRTWFTFD